MYKYLPIYLGRYLHNKFLVPLSGIVLNCVFKVFPFILVISVYDNLQKKKKKISFPLILIFNFCVPFVILFMWGDISTPHGPYSYCFNPYHHVRYCHEMRRFSNYHCDHMNTSFSRPGNDFNSDSYNPTWSQQSNFFRQGLKEKGVYEVNNNNGVQTQMATMEKKLDMIVKVMTTHNISPIQQIAQMEVCAICSQFDHTTETCPMSSSTDQEQANYMGQNNYPPKNNP